MDSTLNLILSKLDSIESDVKSIKDEQVQMRNEINSIKNEQVKMKNELSNLRSEITEMKIDFNNRFDTLEEKIDGIHEQVANNTEQLTFIKEYQNKHNKTITLLSRRSIEQEAQIENMT